MTIEEVARQGPESSNSTDTEVFGKNFKRQFLEDQKVFLAEISNFVSGAHDNRGGGTTRPSIQRFS